MANVFSYLQNCQLKCICWHGLALELTAVTRPLKVEGQTQMGIGVENRGGRIGEDGNGQYVNGASAHKRPNAAKVLYNNSSSYVRN